MINSTLVFKEIKGNENLISDVTLNCIKNNFTFEEQKEIYVTEIDTNYIDGISLCEHYNVERSHGANCLVCECKRGQNKQYVALLIPVGYKYDMSGVVRKHTNSRMVSVAPLDYVLEQTKMEHGSINPIGLPADWKLFVDPKLLDVDRIVCGSGKRISKVSMPSSYLLKLPNVELLEGLAKSLS